MRRYTVEELTEWSILKVEARAVGLRLKFPREDCDPSLGAIMRRARQRVYEIRYRPQNWEKLPEE